MIAIGYTNTGKMKKFIIDSNGVLLCYDEDLISLEIPEGAKKVWCNKRINYS